MEDEEMLDTTNEAENTDNSSVEENEEVELTDGREVEEDGSDNQDQNSEETNQEDVNSTQKKSLRDLLSENPELQEEFNTTMQKRLSRQKANLQREYDGKYSKVESLLSAGLKGKDLDENIKLLEEMYQEQGIDIPTQQQNHYSQREIEILANAEADSIIADGYDVIVDETKRLLDKGYENMTERDKIIFKKLGEAKKSTEDLKEIRKLGLQDNFVNDEDFKNFIKEYELPDSMPFSKKYELFAKSNLKNKEPVKNPGSMRNTDSKVERDWFTSEEVDQLTKEQYNDPNIMKKIERSFSHWK